MRSDNSPVFKTPLGGLPDPLHRLSSFDSIDLDLVRRPSSAISEIDFDDSPDTTALQTELLEEKGLTTDLRVLLSNRSQEVEVLEATVRSLKETSMLDGERLVVLSDELVRIKLKSGELEMENETMCADGAAMLLKVFRENCCDFIVCFVILFSL